MRQRGSQRSRVAPARRPARLLGALAVAALALVAVTGCGGSDDSTDGAVVSGDVTAGGTPTFPVLPSGADRALASKPAAGAGSGTLTRLVVTPLIQGAGPAVTAGQNLTVNYVGVSYANGTEFDSSWSRSEPFTFAVGTGSVIKGWDQGLVGVKVGSRVQLDIPSDLAYGDNAGGGAPAGPLRFVVDVLAAQ